MKSRGAHIFRCKVCWSNCLTFYLGTINDVSTWSKTLTFFQQQEVKRAPSKAGSSQTEPVRKMKLPIFIADAFTVTAFHGNPAAVCLLESTLDEDAHQHIAREMNLSETAFVRKLQPTDNFTQSSRFGLRWFTPEAEFPLCGHATLASAAVLFHKRRLP